MTDFLKKFKRPILSASFLAVIAVAVFGFSGNMSSAEETAKKAMEECNSLKNKNLSKETCYSKEFSAISQKNGSEFAFDALFALQEIDPTSKGCHFIAHGIGQGTYKRSPGTAHDNIQNINPACNYGAMHGIMESYVGDQENGALTTQIVKNLCGENPRADCNHIVGHLLLLETRADVDKALELCGVFKDKPSQLEFCYTGVFMEYQTALNLIAHGYAPESWFNWPQRVGELEIMCRKYDGILAVSCWKEITHAALAKFENNPKKIFEFCETAQVEEGKKECKRHSIGIMAAAKDFNLKSLRGMCTIKQPFDSAFESDCYVQLVASALSTLPNMIPQGKDFCSSIPKEYQAQCFNQISFFEDPTNLQQWNIND